MVDPVRRALASGLGVDLDCDEIQTLARAATVDAMRPRSDAAVATDDDRCRSVWCAPPGASGRVVGLVGVPNTVTG